MKIVVIGGGASGIVASIFAKRDNNEVIVLEKNNKCLKKLLITGNGKCNYFNENFSIDHYYSDSIDSLSDIITSENKNNVLEFFSSIGVVARVKNGCYYPNSNQSYSVYNSLLKEASLRGVVVKNDIKVLNIVKNDSYFIVSTNNGDFYCDKVIISTGGKSYPKTGSEGDGYIFGKSLGHSIISVYPSLVSLISKNNLKDLSGVRCDASVSLFCGKVLKTEIGEVQFTDYGLSGICIFNLSNLVNKLLNSGKQVCVKVNFFNGFNIDSYNDFCKFFDQFNKCVQNRSITELLEGYLNYKIVNIILKMCKISSDKSWNSLNDSEKKCLFSYLTSFNVDIIDTKGFDVAQVSIGGISLNDVDINSFESKIVSGLYFTGEVLDVTGDCGGYNLGFAFLSGMLAGESVGGIND